MNIENPEISLVIPCYNEEGNLRELIKAIRESVNPLKISYEVVITDDCSKDKSWEILKELAAADPHIRAQKLAFNCGESAASYAGLKAAHGKYLFTLDADLQNDPKDLPKFLEQLKHFDCVCGTRVKVRGEGDHFIRVASSRIANASTGSQPSSFESRGTANTCSSTTHTLTLMAVALGPTAGRA